MTGYQIKKHLFRTVYNYANEWVYRDLKTTFSRLNSDDWLFSKELRHGYLTLITENYNYTVMPEPSIPNFLYKYHRKLKKSVITKFCLYYAEKGIKDQVIDILADEYLDQNNKLYYHLKLI